MDVDPPRHYCRGLVASTSRMIHMGALANFPCRDAYICGNRQCLCYLLAWMAT